MFIHAIHKDLKTRENTPRPVLYAGSGEFAGMNDFEVVSYLIVFSQTTLFIEISKIELDFSR
jgi:hypothetical protein